MSKILIVSHGFTGVTGFSNQAYLMCRALTDAGHEVLGAHRDYRGEAIKFGPGTVSESGRDMSGITILPWGDQQWGEDILPFYIATLKPDYVLTLGDIWCYQFLRQVPKTHPWKWIAHYVFDTENMVSFWNDCVANADLVVVPSKQSYDMLTRIGHENVVYIPHGIRTSVFRPASPAEKMQFRANLSIPQNSFLVTTIAHNQHRKKLSRGLQAFKLFSDRHPDALLLLHCSVRDQFGWDLGQLIKDWGLTGKVLFTNMNSKCSGDNHVPEEAMRQLYCASDVHCLPTGGEGFGIPIVEAMACGIPNVATAYTTTREFLGENERGIAVPYVDIDFHHTGGAWAHVDIEQMAAALEALYQQRELGALMGRKARAFAVDNYDVGVVARAWAMLFEHADELIAAHEAKQRVGGLRAVVFNG
jgi:glycosyltransferase involved in cell wall biosynthesis